MNCRDLCLKWATTDIKDEIANLTIEITLFQLALSFARTWELGKGIGSQGF
jgi:hypothetical protein